MVARRSKSHLPSKPCHACGRPMRWRRRWAKHWDDVRYCSQRCRAGSGRTARP